MRVIRVIGVIGVIRVIRVIRVIIRTSVSRAARARVANADKTGL